MINHVISSYFVNYLHLVTGIKDWLIPSVCILAFGAVWGISGVWIGLGVAPFFSIVLTLLFVYLRYGREKFPLLLERDPKTVRIFDAELSKDGIMKLRDQVEAFLEEEQVSPRTTNRAMLFIEEVGMLTAEQNRGQKALCECSVMIGEDVQVIFRDDGAAYDPTNADNQVESLRSYLVANLMLRTKDRRSLVTTGCNRNMLRLER